jgi:hypothetical protein
MWDTKSDPQLAGGRRLPTATSRVRDCVKSCGICGQQYGSGAGLNRVRLLPLKLYDSTNCSTVVTIYDPGLLQ